MGSVQPQKPFFSIFLRQTSLLGTKRPPFGNLACGSMKKVDFLTWLLPTGTKLGGYCSSAWPPLVIACLVLKEKLLIRTVLSFLKNNLVAPVFCSLKVCVDICFMLSWLWKNPQVMNNWLRMTKHKILIRFFVASQLLTRLYRI